ncbi:MAG TPA: G1 family glutamic endopeptidase, partial [Candidatus Paceibacterota bacterium]|nr:G1 family glutamic endopeptidase [Candidatus Paceibacterota bacterium]
PGDTVSASVTEVTPGQWRIMIANLSTNQVYQTIVAYDSSHSSAEWIVERPLAITNDATGYLPLSNFGEVTFTDATFTDDGSSTSLDATNVQPLIMAGTGSHLLAAPQKIQNDSFDVSYLTASEGARYLRSLRRAYTIERDSPTVSRTPSYQEIDTSYVIRVVFDAAH